MTQTEQNAPYGYYELGLRADQLQVELEAACLACTHLDEKLKVAEAERAASEARVDEVEGWYNRAMRDVVNLNKSRAAAERRAKAAEAKLQAVEALLKKPGAWSEWARECLAVISGGGK